MRVAIGLSLVVAAAAPLLSARAQQDTLLVPRGARVRLRTDDASDTAWHVGTLASVRPETLLVERCRRCLPDAYARDRVHDFQASIGRPSHAGAGVALGALAGAAVIALGVHDCRDTGEGPPCALGYTVLPIAAIGGGIGGGIIGSFVPAGPERWRPARLASARDASVAVPARASSWFEKPVPGARGGAQFGALVGAPLGALYGLGTETCYVTAVRGEATSCRMRGAVLGLAGGAFVGSVLGAGIGAAGVSRCPAAASFGRALAGAALWTAPAVAAYQLLRRQRDPEHRTVGLFVAGVSLPFVQAEGAARAASGACARGGR